MILKSQEPISPSLFSVNELNIVAPITKKFNKLKQILRFQILTFKYSHCKCHFGTIQCGVSDCYSTSDQDKRQRKELRVNSSTLIAVSAQNIHEWTSDGMLKEQVQLTEIHILSHVIVQSVIQLRTCVYLTACKQCRMYLRKTYLVTINSLVS